MVDKTQDSPTLVTLPFVLGIVVVIGGVAALALSGLFMYQARATRIEAELLRARLAAQQAQAAQQPSDESVPAEAEVNPVDPPPGIADPAADDELTADATALKPGARLHAQRPAHWDEAEVIDILENSQIKVRWLSGEPGEAVIASELVRNEEPPTN